MKKTLLLCLLLIFGGATLAGCSAPPPLLSDKYLNDTSLLATGDQCGPPCFHGITLNKTSYTDAQAKLKADTAFKDIQVKDQDKPPQILWSTAAGEPCCVLSADQQTGLVNALLVKLAPTMTTKQVLNRYGSPKYVFTTDYSASEVAVAMVYPDKDIVVWVVPGDPNSTLKETSPVVMTLYLNDSDFQNTLKQTPLQAWASYLPYQTYKNATPVITPAVTPTP
ncbi:MAG TPA: hypothetical protein VMT34_07380 [Aggregatilineales bacterium]|nr:hypothetical protein [Aggregatilineales bacterium]